MVYLGIKAQIHVYGNSFGLIRGIHEVKICLSRYKHLICYFFLNYGGHREKNTMDNLLNKEDNYIIIFLVFVL